MVSTLVIGASENPERYAYQAIHMLRAYGHPTWALGRTPGLVSDVPILTDPADIPAIDTVTLYLNPAAQAAWADWLVALNPRRVIFNPGTEHAELAQRLIRSGVDVVEACTLVMLRTGQYAPPVVQTDDL
ncbi:MAG: CoA-binding protein [Bacteroidia bacterium]|nr:CoA-binding protein [Bacteroidia bacterium]